MLVFFLIEYISRVAASMSISFGTWLVYKSANGVYYSVKWLTGGTPQPITEEELKEIDKPVIILTEEEYTALLENKKEYTEINKRLENLETKLTN